MDKEKIGELKIQLQQWMNEAQEFIQEIPPEQLYAAAGVLLFTIFLFIISKSRLTEDLFINFEFHGLCFANTMKAKICAFGSFSPVFEKLVASVLKFLNFTYFLALMCFRVFYRDFIPNFVVFLWHCFPNA